MISICGDDGDRDRESETDVHAARISLHRLIDEFADLGEARDFRHQSLSFRLGKPDQRRVHEDVLDAGELRIESGAELEQRRDSTFKPNRSVRRFECAGDDLQQRRLARAVWTNDAGGCAGFDFETDVAERPEFAMSLPAPARQRFFQSIDGPVVDAVLLGYRFNAYCWRHKLFAKDRTRPFL